MSSVHSTHCCKRHGCKYGDDECPVVLGTETQEYHQECCDIVAEHLLDAYRKIYYDLKEKNREQITIAEIKAIIDKDKRYDGE